MYLPKEHGQGLLVFAVVLLLIAVVVIGILVAVSAMTGNIHWPTPTPHP